MGTPTKFAGSAFLDRQLIKVYLLSLPVCRHVFMSVLNQTSRSTAEIEVLPPIFLCSAPRSLVGRLKHRPARSVCLILIPLLVYHLLEIREDRQIASTRNTVSIEIRCTV